MTTKKKTTKKRVTLQSLFNKAVKGLAKQGFEKSTLEDAAGKRCVYIKSDGMRCAIGHLVSKTVASKLPAASYYQASPFMPESITQILDLPPKNSGYTTVGTALQCCHDMATSSEQVKANLIRFANNHKLNIPKELFL